MLSFLRPAQTKHAAIPDGTGVPDSQLSNRGNPQHLKVIAPTNIPSNPFSACGKDAETTSHSSNAKCSYSIPSSRAYPKNESPPHQRCHAAAPGRGWEQPGRAALAPARHSDHFVGIFTALTATCAHVSRLQPSAPSAVHSTAPLPKIAVSVSACAGGTH